MTAIVQEDLRAIAEHLHSHPLDPSHADYLAQLAFVSRSTRQWITQQPVPSQQVISLGASQGYLRPNLEGRYLVKNSTPSDTRSRFLRTLSIT